MNGKTVEPVNILVSREELLFVLKALGADFIPGLEAAALAELPAEQQTLALAVAERALRARDLVRGLAGRDAEIHTALLTMVGVCAYAHHVVFAYHWPANASAPRQYFGHIRGDDIVAHTRPNDGLHLFSLLPDKSYLSDQILAFCQWADAPATAAVELAVSSATFATARELAGAGQLEPARQTLTGSGVAAAAASALVDTLASLARISILQTVKQPGGGGIQKHDITLLQDGQRAWLVIAPEDGAAETRLRIKTANRAEVRELLETCL